MAKKTVATLRTTSGNQFTKVYKMAKSPKTGAYVFVEKVVHQDALKDYLEEKN